MKEFYWFWRNIFEIVRVASGCRASIETEECEWGLFNLNSNWRRKVVVVVDPLFSRRRIRNSICFYDFSCSAPPLHCPTLDVKSHWGKKVSSPEFALVFGCLNADSLLTRKGGRSCWAAHYGKSTMPNVDQIHFNVILLSLHAWCDLPRCWAHGLFWSSLFFLARNGLPTTTVIHGIIVAIVRGKKWTTGKRRIVGSVAEKEE